MFPNPTLAGLLIPATTARLQIKTVPAVPLVGIYENNVLLQVAGGFKLLVSTGLGLTETVTFCVFEHPFAVSVNT